MLDKAAVTWPKKKLPSLSYRRGKDLSLLQKFQTYFIGYRGPFAGLKQPGSDAEHSPPTRAKVEWVELYLHFPYLPSWGGQVQLYFYYSNLLPPLPVPVAARSKAWVCGRSPAESGFESHRGHRCLSVVSIVCCQVEVSATSWSPVQRSPTDCGASLCVI